MAGLVALALCGCQADPPTLDLEAVSAGGARLRAGRTPEGGLAVAWSRAGETTWTTRDLGVQGVSEVQVAAAPDGRFLLLWIGAPDRPSEEVGSRPLLLAESRDSGRTFSVPRTITGRDLWACDCCRPAMEVDATGRLWIAYRTSVDYAKEVVLLDSADGVEFTAQRLSLEKWETRACPRDGPSLAVSPSGVSVTWTDRGVAFRAEVRDGVVTRGR